MLWLTRNKLSSLVAGLLLFPVMVLAEMAQIDDEALSDVTGQSGVYLSGEISINEDNTGGPLNNTYFGNCSAPNKVCGARLAFQTEQRNELEGRGGWFVIDNIRGSIAFEGLTLQVKNINSGFGGDGALFNSEVIAIGMPESLRFNDFEYTLATGSHARPTDSGYQQVDLMTIEMSGEATVQGELLIFPTD